MQVRLLSCIIDAKEGRDVAVINIPNAFIQMQVEDKGDVNKIINAFDKAEPKGVGTKSSTAPDDLFKVNENHKKLHLKRP
jgi:ferritin